MIQLTHREWRIFRHLQKKHKVSSAFLRYNLNNIKNIIFHETWPRIIIKRFVIRKTNRVFIIWNRLRRLLFDEKNRKICSRFRQNLRLWSKRIVAYRRRTQGTEEYVEEIVCSKPSTEPKNVNILISAHRKKNNENVKDVSEQLKQQLELLKSRSRQVPLIETTIVAAGATAKTIENTDANSEVQNKAENVMPTANANQQKSDRNLEKIKNIIQDSIRLNNVKQAERIQTQPAIVQDNQKKTNLSCEKTGQDWQVQLLKNTPEKQKVNNENVQPQKQLATDKKSDSSQSEDNTTQKSYEKVVKTGLNFLDMLMCKVSSGQAGGSKADSSGTKLNQHSCNDNLDQQEHSLDSTDEFLGFEENERLPGMLMTPIVPFSGINHKNSVFVSETLNEYMRANDLETDYNIDNDKAITRPKITHTEVEGLVTLKTEPPPFHMPAVPDNLLRFRTVAERKNYLSKCAKNYRLSIINNEANIYRDLQKRMRYQKTKHSSQLMAQSANSSMSFTRLGWQTASFINTEFNKYYYQTLNVDNGRHVVKLRGVRGNNDELFKKPYQSTKKKTYNTCPSQCVDLDMWQDFKPIPTVSAKAKKLNKEPLPSVFKPCPLSHKVMQKPLDDDAAALLLAGGSMAVVRMPTVELEVFPEFGRPLNEIAKRYLQYILPHHDISREWAEFSVSTLRLPGSLKEAVQAAADSIPRKSFTFLIPYLNDRNHVLVRRVVDRSEKLDQSFENSLETELVPKTDFSFRKNLDNADDVLLECADVVSDMINTVAISCSENSFIKPDPDMLNEEKLENIQLSPSSKIKRPPSSASNGPPAKKPTKQKRVLMELRRLNATIIDAAVKPEEDKPPCTKEYCAMGCICNSISEESRLREHCGKAKCILECSCKASNQSRIMRLETDGRTITTEDAFMLRRKATARLARMEKEFTSTVVLTENETLLINETNNDKKRRCTKLPKRYEYADESDDEPRMSSCKKTALTTIDNEKNLAVDVKEIRDPVYVKDTVLEQMKHCTVNLVKLNVMDNLVPWCMIHQLYKCFCKGRALDGKPMIIEKDENNTTIEHAEDDEDEVEYKSSSKVRYTFEKEEKIKKSTNQDEENSEDDIHNANHNATQVFNNESAVADEVVQRTRLYSEDDSSAGPSPSHSRHDKNATDVEQQEQGEKPKRSLEDVRSRFYESRPECCRRQIPIPRRMFLYCNRKRRLEVLKYIRTNETEKTRVLLNEHVMRSVYYHKIDTERTQKRMVEENKDSPKEKQETQVEEKTSQKITNLCITKQSPIRSEVVDLLDDEEQVVKLNEKPQSSNTINEVVTPLTLNQKEIKDLAKNIPATISSNENEITLKKLGLGTGSYNNSTLPTNVDQSEELKLPKISNCFSLNAKANMQYPPTKSTETPSTLQHQHMADFTSATTVYSNSFNASRLKTNNNTQLAGQPEILESNTGCQFPPHIDNDSVRDVYNNVIRTMNSLVSKKMQDVDSAVKRDSHIIPTPNADILCMMKWSNFLDAYCKGFAFIWQVKSRKATYLVATARNILPMVCDAMAVLNISALRPEFLPFMGKMLVLKVRNEQTAKLAVVMQGKQTYWVVKGFLKAEPTTACNKPTPETHPSLTKKINVLCTSLVKQRQKDDKNRGIVAQKNSAPVKSAKVPQNLPTPRMQPPTPSAQSTTAQLIKQSSIFVPHPPNTQTNMANKSNNSLISRKRKLPFEPNAMTLNNLPEMESYAKMKTNIEFRNVTSQDMDEIHLPEVHKNNHKWLVLDLYNDFSHIFVPDFHDLVSLDRIQKVIKFARQKNKIVKLQFFQNAPFDAFVTPKSERKIYFGPLDMNMKPPTLILLQSVDGQIVLREMYQLDHDIRKSPGTETTAFWLLQINGKTHFEVNVDPAKELENNNSAETTLMSHSQQEGAKKHQDINNEENDEDDEDCVIIDPDEDEKCLQLNTEAEGRYNFIIAAKPNDNAISITPQKNSLPGPPPIQSLLNTCKPSVTITSVESTTLPIQMLPNTNTIIKPVVPTTAAMSANTAQFAPPAKTFITGISTTPTSSNTIVINSVLKLPSNPIITSITPAPPEAPYGSTIFLRATTPNVNNQIPISHATNVSKPEVVPPISDVITLKDDEIEQGKATAEKRRRVSLVCNNSGYDLNSQSIAVNAVINKLLPENVKDIEVNKPESEKPNTLEISSKIGSTTIKKIVEKPSFYQQQKSNEGKDESARPIKPVVFDVSFMDGTDEPAASIVIKPTPSPTKLSNRLLPNSITANNSVIYSSAAAASISTVNATATVSKPHPKPANCTTTSLNLLPRVQPTVSHSGATTIISKFNSKPANNRGYKVVRIPPSLPMAGNTVATQSIKKVLLPQNATSLPLATSVAQVTSVQQQRPILPTNVLSSSSSIKITPITPSPTTKATIRPVESLKTSISITPVSKATAKTSAVGVQNRDFVKILSPSNIKSRCVTIRQILPKPTGAEVLPSAQETLLTLNNSKPQKIPIATTAATTSAASTSTSKSLSFSLCSTIPPPAYTTAITNSTISSPPNSTVNTLNPPLAITNVQTIATSAQKDELPTNASLPSHIQYGYMVSTSYMDQKFVAKRVMDEFYVKVPSVGIMKLIGLSAVDNSLNTYMQTLSDKNTKPGKWQFLAASKDIQIQNHQKSLLVRQTQSTGSTEMKLPTRLNASKTNSNKSQKVVNITSISEPILIDD